MEGLFARGAARRHTGPGLAAHDDGTGNVQVGVAKSRMSVLVTSLGEECGFRREAGRHSDQRPASSRFEAGHHSNQKAGQFSALKITFH
ncbi:hypothetical protein [Mesorhizobium sp. M0322]|uniref:hypothetical protein n=1 Tax=Mesorhizobium sp. M0322 TaxID=2956937 RepID=UPI0033368A8F